MSCNAQLLVLLQLLWIFISPLSSTISKRVSDRWKIPADVSAGTLFSWAEKDAELHAFMTSTIPQALNHTGATSFDSHLRGVRDVLRVWKAEEHVQQAGLFHSIYGTEGFQGFKISFNKRKDIETLIGKKAEKLAWIFCVIDRLSVDNAVKNYCDAIMKSNLDMSAMLPVRCRSRLELGNFPVNFISNEEWFDFIELSLADWLEQVEGAAEKKNPLFEWEVGEAWSYRRVAYGRMADLLSFCRHPRLQCAKEMYDEVYAMEPQETRHLHQVSTPPMSDAAREAREAMKSISLDVVNDNYD